MMPSSIILVLQRSSRPIRNDGLVRHPHFDAHHFQTPLATCPQITVSRTAALPDWPWSPCSPLSPTPRASCLKTESGDESQMSQGLAIIQAAASNLAASAVVSGRYGQALLGDINDGIKLLSAGCVEACGYGRITY